MAQYVVLLHSDLATFGVYKTTGDPTDEGTWSAQDGAVWHGPGTVRSLWAVLDGTDIHVVSVDDASGPKGGGAVRYSKFSTSTDTWTIESEFVAEAAEDNATRLGAAEHGVSIGVRSDGDVIVLYTRENAANNVPEVVYARREGGSWTSDIAVESVSATDIRAGVIVPGSSDRMHLLYTDTTNDDVKSRTLNSANSLSSIVTVDASVEAANSKHNVVAGAHYDDGGTERVRAPYSDASGKLSIAECDSADAPTWGTTVDVSDSTVKVPTNLSPIACMAVDSKNLQLLYAVAADQDIFYDQNDDDAGWGTDSEENDGVTCDALSCGVYTRSGQKLGYIWDNTGTVTFSEIDLAAGGIAHVTTLTEALTASEVAPLIKEPAKIIEQAADLADAIVLAVTKRLTDSLMFDDDLVKAVVKILADDLTLLDEVVALLWDRTTLEEPLTLDDQLRLAATKILEESLTIAEDSLRLIVTKRLEDALNLEDRLILAATKVLPEEALTLDDVVRRILIATVTLAEDLTLEDALRLALTKVLGEDLTVDDALLTVIGKVVFLADDLDLSEERISVVTKRLADSLTISDDISFIRIVTRVLEDSLTPLDELVSFLWLRTTIEEPLTLEDALLKAMTKVITEQVSIIDALRLAFTKVLEEGLSLDDALDSRLWLRTTLTEPLTAADELRLAIVKLLGDDLSLADALRLVLARVLPVEGMVLDDSLRLTFAKLLDDSFTPVEALRLMATKVVGDSLSISEEAVKVYGKVLLQGLTLEDALTAAISGEAVVHLTTILETLAMQDALTALLVKLATLAESLALSDILSVRKAGPFVARRLTYEPETRQGPTMTEDERMRGI